MININTHTIAALAAACEILKGVTFYSELRLRSNKHQNIRCNKKGAFFLYSAICSLFNSPSPPRLDFLQSEYRATSLLVSHQINSKILLSVCTLEEGIRLGQDVPASD